MQFSLRLVMRRCALAGLFLLLLGGAEWAGAQPALGPIVRVAGIDGGVGGDVGSYTALAQDGFGGQHLAYYDATRGVLRYARRPRLGRPWRYMDLDTEGDSGRYAAIGVSRVPYQLPATATLRNGDVMATVTLGGPPLAEGHVGGRLRVVSQPTWYELVAVNGATFTAELGTPYVGPDLVNAVCEFEFFMPAIAWQTRTVGEAAKVAEPGISGVFNITRIAPWQSLSVGATDRQGYFMTIDMDTTRSVHVAWQDRGVSINGMLRYARKPTAGAWQDFETVDPYTGRGWNSRLVTDDAFSATILHRDQTIDKLVTSQRLAPNDYARSEIVDAAGGAIDVKYLPSLDRLTYAYRRTLTPASNHYEIRLGRAQDVTAEFVYNIGNVIASGFGVGESLAVAGGETSDSIRVVHFDELDGKLRFNRWLDSTSTVTPAVTLDGGYKVGRYVQAGLNPADGALYAGYYDEASGALKLAREDAGTTSTEYVDGFKAGTYSSIGETTEGTVVAYHHDAEGSLRVARWPLGSSPGGPGSTDVLVDNSTPDVGKFATLRVNAAGQIVVAYLDRVFMNLKIAVYNPADGKWYTYTVLGESGLYAFHEVGEWASLDLRDAKGVASCYNATLQIPIYTTFNLPTPAPGRPSITFAEYQVPSPIGTGRQSSICFGPGSSEFYMAYFNEPAASLEYALFGEGNSGILRETVEQGTFTGAARHMSIARNPATSLPAIAYHDMNDGSLKFAERVATNAWEISVLDNDGVTGQYPRLLFDAARNVSYISYYAFSAGELRLMTRAGGNPWQGPYTLATGGRGLRPAMVLTSDNRLDFSFHDETAGDLLSSGTDAPLVVSGARNWAAFE